MEDLLTEQKAAELLSITKGTMRQWRLRKKGPAFIKMGKAVRYLKSDIEEFIQKKRITNVHSQQ